jgi:hypothetical protein
MEVKKDTKKATTNGITGWTSTPDMGKSMGLRLYLPHKRMTMDRWIIQPEQKFIMFDDLRTELNDMRWTDDGKSIN